jgi:hypothetical protein
MSRPFYREPLVHFLTVGALIFGLNTLRGPPVATDSNRIVVTVGQIERMARLWSQNRKRPPSDAELQALVREHVKEEIYYREALKMGLDMNDTVIRRRLRQKMEFLASAVSDVAEPDEATLQSFLHDNAQRYEIGPRFSFEQVYFRENDAAAIASALAQLRAGTVEPGESGDSISLPARMSAANKLKVSRVFGEAFYDGLVKSTAGRWQGPLPSGFGVHLVVISAVTPARMPTLDEIRQIIEHDWRAKQKKALENTTFEQFLDSYEIVIESPGS